MAKPNNPSRNGAKLTPEKVREIRANRRGLIDQKQAELYGVHKQTIFAARKGITWGHV